MKEKCIPTKGFRFKQQGSVIKKYTPIWHRYFPRTTPQRKTADERRWTIDGLLII